MTIVERALELLSNDSRLGLGSGMSFWLALTPAGPCSDGGRTLTAAPGPLETRDDVRDPVAIGG